MPRKTDREVEQWVLRALSLSEKGRCSPEICVLARDGVVRLRGSARSFEDRSAVVEATRRATGVVGVVNELKVKPGTALIENGSATVPLAEPQSPVVLVQPLAVRRLLINATTG